MSNEKSGADMRTKELPVYRGKRPAFTGDHPCIVCDKEVNPRTARYVHVINGGQVVLHPNDERLYVPDGGDMGGHPIGPDCARRLGLEWSTPASELRHHGGAQ